MRRYEKVGFPIPEEGEGKYLEKKKYFFAEEKKNREGKGRKCLEKGKYLVSGGE